MLTTKLSEVMKQEGRKQAWLHERTGISRNTISRIVNGKVMPSLEHAIKISRALGRTVEELWDMKEDE